jgi:hypothetical protein
MDHFADLQISSQGNLTHVRKRYVVTPTSAPVEVQHLSNSESRDIVDRLKLNKELTPQYVLDELKERMAAAAALSREEKLHLAAERARTHISVLRWLPALNWATVKADTLAGLTVGVMVIPQSISYANIAGIPYVYGMYSALTPTIIYALLGNSRHQVVGPVAIVCLLIEVGLRGRLTEEECPAFFDEVINPGQKLTQYQLCPTEYAYLAMLLAFLVGLLQLAGGLLNVGFLVSFLGYRAAALACCWLTACWWLTAWSCPRLLLPGSLLLACCPRRCVPAVPWRAAGPGEAASRSRARQQGAAHHQRALPRQRGQARQQRHGVTRRAALVFWDALRGCACPWGGEGSPGGGEARQPSPYPHANHTHPHANPHSHPRPRPSLRPSPPPSHPLGTRSCLASPQAQQ